MIPKDEARDFLTSRRARLTPEQVGLSTFGTNRRVSGLRREEVALLAGVSVDYYIKLERGNLASASTSVLSSIAKALRLNDTERTYLFTLASAAGAFKAPEPLEVRESLKFSLQQAIDQMSQTGVYVRNTRLDVVGANAMAMRIFPWLKDQDGSFTNIARFTFLNPAAKAFFPLWNKVAADAVLILRMHSVNNPQDRPLQELIAELDRTSEIFREMWSANDLHRQQVESKQFNHPELGALELDFQILTLADEPSLTMLVYSSGEQTDTHARLRHKET